MPDCQLVSWYIRLVYRTVGHVPIYPTVQLSDTIRSEEIIMVNRVIRDDPSKGTMHNREPITPKLLWKSLKDYDLWPIYALGLCFQTPLTTPKQYLTLTLRGLGFNTFMTNLLIIPSEALSIIFILILTYTSEITGELTLTSMIGQIWALPFVLCLYILDINTMNKWSAWALMTLLLSYPNCKLTYPFPLFLHQYHYLLHHSARYSSWLELPQFQHCPFAHGFCSHV